MCPPPNPPSYSVAYPEFLHTASDSLSRVAMQVLVFGAAAVEPEGARQKNLKEMRSWDTSAFCIKLSSWKIHPSLPSSQQASLSRKGTENTFPFLTKSKITIDS